ncbi:SnoaL-like domain protein [compost metagenome]
MNQTFQDHPASHFEPQPCIQSVIDFTTGFDLHDTDAMLRHFARNGVWVRQDSQIVGIDALRDFMQRRPAHVLVRHVLTNLRARLLETDRAVVESYVTVYRYDGGTARPAILGGPELVGRYADRMALEDGVWKIAHRQAVIDFHRN